MRLAQAALAALALVACTTEKSGAEHGADLFNSTDAFTRSSTNPFSCADCHRTTAEPEAGDDRIFPGATLHGVVARERWWGGQALSLADAVDTCVVYFMRGQPIDRDSDDSRALFAYLESITPPGSPTDVLPMTIVENIAPVPLGDATRGAETYRRACQPCHGAAHTGAGSILSKQILLPEVTDEYDTIFPGTPKGLVVIEVVRHGRFFNIGGTMPFFTTELLGDDELGDVLAFLGLPAE